jgi:hypothetical protein
MTTKKTPARQAVRSTPLLCDLDCNHCPLVIHSNTRLLSALLNQLHDRFGDEVYHMVQTACPNMTCCADCRIDDFCHVEGCEIVEHNAENQGRKPASERTV